MKKLVAQFILNSLLKKRSNNLLNRVKNFILKKARFLLVKMGDPLVSYNLHGVRLALPLSHDLPLIQKRYTYYSTNVGRLAKCVFEKYPSMKFIDIGANVGDTVACLRNHVCCPILCIEGAGLYFDLLKQNTSHLDGIYLSNSFVGQNDGEVGASLVYGQGTANLSPSMSNVAMQSLESVLKKYPDFYDTRMIKIDTDGMDNSIIRGALKFLSQVHPVVLFEYDPFFLAKTGDNGVGIFSELRSIGYDRIIVYDNYGYYMLSLPLSDMNLIEDLHSYMVGWRGERYYDLCVFHLDDSDIATDFRDEEILFFSNVEGEI